MSLDYVVKVPGAGTLTKNFIAFCMNLSCACSIGNPMLLTEFYFDDTKVMSSQGLVWDHFQSNFAGDR